MDIFAKIRSRKFNFERNRAYLVESRKVFLTSRKIHLIKIGAILLKTSMTYTYSPNVFGS